MRIRKSYAPQRTLYSLPLLARTNAGLPAETQAHKRKLREGARHTTHERTKEEENSHTHAHAARAINTMTRAGGHSPLENDPARAVSSDERHDTQHVPITITHHPSFSRELAF